MNYFVMFISFVYLRVPVDAIPRKESTWDKLVEKIIGKFFKMRQKDFEKVYERLLNWDLLRLSLAQF